MVEKGLECLSLVFNQASAMPGSGIGNASTIGSMIGGVGLTQLSSTAINPLLSNISSQPTTNVVNNSATLVLGSLTNFNAQSFSNFAESFDRFASSSQVCILLHVCITDLYLKLYFKLFLVFQVPCQNLVQLWEKYHDLECLIGDLSSIRTLSQRRIQQLKLPGIHSYLLQHTS